MRPGMSTAPISHELKPSPTRFTHLTRRDLRLASGLVLFAYVVIHLTNHALGLISLASAQRGLDIAVQVWQSVPGTLLLYGAAAIHLTLAFATIYARRTLRMPPIDLVRIILGLGIPLLLIGHAIDQAIRAGATHFDFLRGTEPYKFHWGAKPQSTWRRLLRK